MTAREASGALGPLPVDVTTTAGAWIARHRRRWLPVPLPGDPGAVPALTHQASRALLIGALLYRILATLVPVTVVLVRYGPVRVGAPAAVAGGLLAGTVAALARTARDPAVDLVRTRRLVLVDLALALLVNLLASALVPGAPGDPYHDVFWFYLVTSVVLVTGGYGLRGGLAAVALAVPLRLAMGLVGDQPAADLTASLGQLMWLATGALMAMVVLTLVGLGAQEALRQGERAGQDAERARILRSMHDTVLQTLEALALDTDADRHTPAQALARLRQAARTEAVALRGILDDLVAARAGRLRDALGGVVRAATALGVRADLVMSELDDSGLSGPRVAALRDAVREALRNVAQHAGVDRAVVRVEPAGGGIRVVIRDHGRGFCPGAGTGGFGVSESIVARVRDAGGTATVESWPGRGTRIRLWVPA